MSAKIIPAMLERKKSFIMAAFDLLPEFEARLDQKDNYTYSFMMLVNTLDAYPPGICPAPNNAKTLIYCADSLVSASLAVLWQGELIPADIENIGDLLENAMDSICNAENCYKP